MFINNITPKFIRKSFSKYLRNLLKAILRGNRSGRFVLLSPAFLTNQYVYDRKKKGFLGLRIRSNIDFLTLCQIYQSNDYGLEKLGRRRELLAYYQNILSQGKMPLIIDCGGNIGLASRYFSNEYPEAKILLVEPEHSNIEQARINNDESKIHFYEKAIGCRDERGEVIDPGLGEWGYRIETSKEGKTEIISINTLLETYAPDCYLPFIVKIDIEGFEANLFLENTEWVDKFPLMIIELHDWMLPRSANSSNFLKIIASLNRDFVYHGENVFSISNNLSQETE
jgi:FkbM family methyltransferase